MLRLDNFFICAKLVRPYITKKNLKINPILQSWKFPTIKGYLAINRNSLINFQLREKLLILFIIIM